MDFGDRLSAILAGRNAKGCSEAEVSALEREYNVSLPTDYREFLLRAGRGANGLWRGSDYTFDTLPEMQQAAVELLREAGLILPQDSFVFFMHQGYQFFFLNPEGVFFFVEGNKEVERRHDSFREFFEATADVL